MLRDALLDAWALIAPPLCAACGLASDAPLCPGCAAALVPAPPRALPGVAAIHTPFLLGGPLQTAIHRLKYRGLEWVGPRLGALWLVTTRARPRVDAILPVPLSSSRLVERGFNQAQRIAEPLSRALGIPTLGRAILRAPAAPQVGRTRAERQHAVRGVFTVRDPRALAGRALLIVDDVVTTGATVSALAAAASAAGATRVEVACLASEP